MPPLMGLCKHDVEQGWGLSLHLMVLLAILYEFMAGHVLQLLFLVPKFQLFPTLVIPRRFLHASWDSESCSYCSLSLEPFSLLPWSRSLDRVGGVSMALSSGVNFFGVYHLELTFFCLTNKSVLARFLEGILS